MDGVGRLHPANAWGEARYGAVLANLLWLSIHHDVEVRLGLLGNPNFPTREADALANRELSAGTNLERVRIEVARSRQVSPTALEGVAACGLWEVWAVLLHNPNCPQCVLKTIASFTSGDAAIAHEYAYLVGRAKEVIKERQNAAVGRTP